MTRIDDADAVSSQKPQSSVRGLRDLRGVEIYRHRAEPDPVGAVEDSGLERDSRIGSPRLEIGSRNAHEPAGRVQPDRPEVIVHEPMNASQGRPFFVVS